MSELPDLKPQARAAAVPFALGLPLTGSHLIEASAGSGKTFTLVALFVRLVLERGLKVDQILTVTFTRAATAELRQRVRRRLIDCRAALLGQSDDPVALALVQGERATVQARLNEAIALIDSAPIYTIHGFAQRALADRAFSAGTSFEIELVDTAEVWTEAMRDFWRRKIVHHDASSGASPRTHQCLVEEMVRSDSVEKWLMWLRPLRTARPVRIERTAPTPIVDIETFEALHRHTANLWKAGRNQFEQFIVNGQGLNRRSYNRRNVANWCNKLDQYFAGPADHAERKVLHRFSHAGLREKLKNPDAPVPQHALIDAIERYVALREAFWSGLFAWRQDVLVACFEEVPVTVARRLAAEQRLGFDDQMVRLFDLLHGARGDTLARALRGRYPAALIDEFQDTDALQDRIFNAIYAGAGETSVFFVGDPKQAIYRFRGADVFTYLAAARRTGQRHALAQNFRSSSALVGAVNTLYGGDEDHFRHQGIKYREVSAAGALVEMLLDDGRSDHAPLRFIVPEGTPDSSGKAAILASAAKGVASEIADMLLRAASGVLTLGARPLRASDIAVLVNSNAQGGQVRRALRRLGIGAADRSRGNVFESEEAEWLQLLLQGVAEAHRSQRIVNALASPLFGLDAHHLLRLQQDELAWQEQLDNFERFRAAWAHGGVMRLLRLILAGLPGAARLAASASGERHLTNLFHLAELIHQNNQHGAGIHAQLAWLMARRLGGLADVEAGELRLESDQNLVQVMTVHKSKGLEFAVVLVPFMFAGRGPAPRDEAGFNLRPVAYHDLEDPDASLVIDFGGDRYEEALRRSEEEERGEEARVLYVALTRAIHRCVVFWDVTSQSDRASLTALIEPQAQRQGASSRDSIRRRLYALSERTRGQLGLFLPKSEPATRMIEAHRDELVLSVRQLVGAVAAPWRTSSFTGLLQRRIAAPELVERPDHDQDAQLPIGHDAGSSMPSREAQSLRFTFQRGASAGECLHDVLERVDFTRPMQDQRGRIAAILATHGLPSRDAPALAHWLQQVFDVPLDGDDLRLASIAAKAQIRELEFHLPMKAAAIATIAALARRHGIVLPELAALRLEGFLKGFIDLVVVHQGRSYVIDYKSNWLGGRPADYRGARLDEAMRLGGYHLQYLLYCLALVRWLRWRDPGFDYERDFGGVFYLFLRGMGGDADDAKSGDGVFSARPPKALLDALDALFQGASRDERLKP